MSEKQKRKQAERDEKRADDILSGRVTYVPYERKKKKAQSNRKGGGMQPGQVDEMVSYTVSILRVILPGILVKLSRIYDPRNPKKIKHDAKTLLLYGLLMFCSHMTSCRSANRELSGEETFENLQDVLPELQTMPHADTLKRFLCAVDEKEIQAQYEEMLREFIRSNTMRKLNPGKFWVLIDGSGKFSRRYNWDERALVSHYTKTNEDIYYATMLESVLVMGNGMVIPLLTEPLSNDNKKSENGKQDCERNAFYRLADRLVRLLGKGCVTVVVDGLYACGPVISKCERYSWDYMIAIKDDSLKTVWSDFDGICEISPENRHEVKWGDRAQVYSWANEIEYVYGGNNRVLHLNLVTCTETWVEEKPRSSGVPEQKWAKYAWLSSEKLCKDNVFHRCTEIGRKRWRIENNFYVEKHRGYQYSHCFSYNWNAMMGFHHLMKIGHFVNTLVTYCEIVAKHVQAEGVQGFIKKFWTTLLIRGRRKEVKRIKSRGRSPTVDKIRYGVLKLVVAT